MKTRSYTIAHVFALITLLTGFTNIGTVPVHSRSGNAEKAPRLRYDPAKVKESYSKIPLSFVANHGQADKNIKFISRGNGYGLALSPTTFTLAVADQPNRNNKDSVLHSRRSVVKATLLGGNTAAKLTGIERLLTKTNYFTGSDPRKWKTNIPNYAKVKYSGVYRGIDLVFYGKQDLIEYDFIVSPGADPKVIALSFDGINDMRIDDDGDLLLRTDAGEIRHSRPIVYQQINNGRRIIPASYLIKGRKQIAFQIADYDRSKPLIIDPTLAFSTYVGGTGGEQASGIAVDSAGNSYITGNTTSADFPTTPGAFDPDKTNLDDDVFVTKLNATGTAIIYSTYFGGSDREAGNDIAVDAAGNAYVIGLTQSFNIPITPGAFRATPVGTDEFDAFAFKLDATGTALGYSTYLGPVVGNGIAVDSAGNAYLTGSANGDYPTTPGAFQTVPGGSSDTFVTKLNPTGTALIYSTFLGGSGFDLGLDVAIDAAGNAYVAGATDGGFPVTPGAFQTSAGGASDAFVAKLNSTGTALLYSTLLAGSAGEFGSGIAINETGNAYVTGVTSSPNFPTTPGAFQTVKATAQDAFVTALNSTGTALVYSTFIGGDDNDFGNDVALDTAGNASISGLTGSTDLPTTPDALHSNYGGNGDGFVATLNATGTALVFSSYFGGTNSDNARSIWVDAAGSIYLTGSTSSPDFPVTPGAFQTELRGFADTFISKIVFSSFDVCFADDGNGDPFQFDSTTGDYSFTQSGAGGLTISGTGTLSRQGCLLVLEDNEPGRRVLVHINECNNKGHAVIQIDNGKKRTFVITDKDTTNSNCASN